MSMVGYPHITIEKGARTDIEVREGPHEEHLFTIDKDILETADVKVKHAAAIEAIHSGLDFYEMVLSTLKFYLTRGYEIEYREHSTRDDVIEIYAVRH
jgi:hypothetical protein